MNYSEKHNFKCKYICSYRLNPYIFSHNESEIYEVFYPLYNKSVQEDSNTVDYDAQLVSVVLKNLQYLKFLTIC